MSKLIKYSEPNGFRALKNHPHFNKASAAAAVILVAAIGTILLFRSHAASPFVSLDLGTGSSLTPPATLVSDSTAAGGSAVRFGGTPPPATGTYPARLSVGFRGVESSLQIINSAATAPTGSSWDATNTNLEVTADNFTLDGVYVKGGVDFYGRGTLTIRNSIIEGGYGNFFTMINGRTDGAIMDIRDSTIRRVSPPSYDGGQGAIQVGATVKIIAMRNDISGSADGIQVAGNNSLFEQNWIHDLALVGTYPNNTHNDGIQLYDGSGIIIRNNRIEIGFNGQNQNAALFFQPGGGNAIPGPLVEGNYLEGGGFVLRLEGTTTNAIIKDNVFGPLNAQQFGEYYANNGATIAQWTNNCRGDADGVKFSPCQAVNQ